MTSCCVCGNNPCNCPKINPEDRSKAIDVGVTINWRKCKMNFNDYQKLAWETAIYPNKGTNLYYPTLGLAGEAGEVAEKVKKIMRDDNGDVTLQKAEELHKEIGDVLWYVAAICSTLNIDMESVAVSNIDKLSSRKERGKLQGDGDNR